MKMKYTILYVNDVEASIQFYHHILGFPIKLRVESYVEFDTGEVTLSINSRQDVKESLGLPVPEAVSSSQTFEIGFVVDDVNETIASLKEKEYLSSRNLPRSRGDKRSVMCLILMDISLKYVMRSPNSCLKE